MGAFTPLAKVWYPDQNDTAKIDTLMATLASSIENGLQPRLALQEKTIGLKASLGGWTIPATNTYTTVPVTVSSSYADFNQGFSISSSGIATVQTPGMYLVTSSLGPQTPDSAGMSASVKSGIAKNGTLFASAEEPMSTGTWMVAQASCVINCVAGDTIQLQGTLAGAPAAAHTTYQQSTYLSIALVRPLPQVS